MEKKTLNIRDTHIGKLIHYPIQRIHIELTNVCNFDCVFCPKSVMTRPAGFMDKDIAFKIIDEIVEQRISEKVTFHIMGEPMMHPKFFDIIGHCKSRGINVGITTNGSLLTEKNVGKLVEADVHQTNISLQTPDEDSFSLRKAGSLGFEQYADRVASYIRRLRENKRDTIVKIHFLNTKYGGSMRKSLKGVDAIADTPTLRSAMSEWVNKIYSIDGIKDEAMRQKVLSGINRVTVNRWNVLEIAAGIFFETYILDSWGNAFADNNIINASFGYCSAMRDHFGILYNGDLILCCKDYNGNTKVGNVREKSIVDLLNTDMVLNVIRGFGKYRIVHTYCRRCLGGQTRSSAILKQAGSIFFMKLMKWYFYNNRKLYL